VPKSQAKDGTAFYTIEKKEEEEEEEEEKEGTAGGLFVLHVLQRLPDQEGDSPP